MKYYFVNKLKAREVKAHVSRKKTGSAVDDCTARGKSYAQSRKLRKLVEEVFDWIKTVGSPHKTREICLAKRQAKPYFALPRKT